MLSIIKDPLLNRHIQLGWGKCLVVAKELGLFDRSNDSFGVLDNYLALALLGRLGSTPKSAKMHSSDIPDRSTPKSAMSLLRILDSSGVLLSGMLSMLLRFLDGSGVLLSGMLSMLLRFLDDSGMLSSETMSCVISECSMDESLLLLGSGVTLLCCWESRTLGGEDLSACAGARLFVVVVVGLARLDVRFAVFLGRISGGGVGGW